MNEKKDGIIAAVVVGVIVAGAQVWIQRSADDNTAVAVATLNERVATLSKQFEKFTEQPYARRDELATVEGRVTGLDQRVSNLERSGVRGRVQ